MTDNKIIWSTDDYVIAVYPAEENVANEPHYGVANMQTGVVEHRCSMLVQAFEYVQNAQEYYNKKFKGEKEVKLMVPEHGVK